tara:strand:+ start:4050 stop:5177 length:1128 start_codon:yes stop_codon:yes gene_type:complete
LAIEDMNVSEINKIFYSQISRSAESTFERAVDYVGVQSDEILNGVPLDASALSFSTDGFIGVDGDFADNLLVNIVTASAVCDSVEIEIPFDFNCVTERFLTTASALNVALVVTLPDSIDDISLETFISTVLTINSLLRELDIEVKVLPFDPAIQAYLASQYGYDPAGVSTSAVMNSMYTDRLSVEQMSRVKQRFVDDFIDEFGDDFALNVAKGVFDFFRNDIEERKQTLRKNSKIILKNYDQWLDFANVFDIDIYYVTAFLFEVTMPFWDVMSHARSHASASQKLDYANEFAKNFFDYYFTASSDRTFLEETLGADYSEFDKFVCKTIVAFKSDTDIAYSTFVKHRDLFVDEFINAVLTSLAYKREAVSSIIATD